MPALAAIAQLTPNTVTADDRTFEYGGHIAYSFTTLGLSRTLNLHRHNVTNCGSSECQGDDHYLTKCRITAGGVSYDHDIDTKILKNGLVHDTFGEFHSHTNGNWTYDQGSFLYAPYVGAPNDMWKYRETWKDQGGTPCDSNDVEL